MTTPRRTGIGPWGLARRSVARLSSWWYLPAIVPGRLVAVLAVWPALLFAFFLVPEVRYFNVPPLFAAAGQPSDKPDQPGSAQQIRKLAVLASPMEGRAAEDFDPAKDDRTSQLRRRVGTNILGAAGYLSEAFSVFEQVRDPRDPPSSYYVLRPDGMAASCATPDVEVAKDKPGVNVAHVALALVAVEKFNRNAVHRFAERTYARLYRSLFGRLPDLSFGPAQIRLSLLRRIAAERPEWPEVAEWASMSDDQLLDQLWQECNALKIAATIALHQLSPPHRASVADVAAAYGGQRRRTAAPIDYASIVDAMVSMMEMELPTKSPLPSPDLRFRSDSPPMGGDPL